MYVTKTVLRRKTYSYHLKNILNRQFRYSFRETKDENKTNLY